MGMLAYLWLFWLRIARVRFMAASLRLTDPC